jgi:hypothetical protein
MRSDLQQAFAASYLADLLNISIYGFFVGVSGFIDTTIDHLSQTFHSVFISFLQNTSLTEHPQNNPHGFLRILQSVHYQSEVELAGGHLQPPRQHMRGMAELLKIARS